MDLDKLNSQFSIKNVDTDQITKALSEHQNSVFKLALIAGALLLVVVMFNDHQAKVRGVHAKISRLQEKLEAIKARDVAIQNFSDFKSSLPKKLNEFELIDLISNYAKAHHVIISSLSPAESKDMGLYDIINVGFNGTCADFKHMMFFLRNIEKSKFPLRIDSWSGHKEQDGQITFVIAISAVLIHS